MMYQPRTYRRLVDPEGLVSFSVCIKETDLHISAERDLTGQAEDLVVQARWEIETFAAAHPRFAEALAPYDVPESAPALVAKMAAADTRARVGPMAAVAGTIAEYVARGLAEHSANVIVENGGDDYLIGTVDRIMSIEAGDSPLSGEVGLRIPKGLQPIAVCTSSGTVGHSLSFGSADAVTVLARDGALADAVATALANRVREADDVQRAVDAAHAVPGVFGVVVIAEDKLGAWGNIHLVSLQ
jgi:ApbE superfamily uncharacterized protein (UPF0280 family)